MEGSDPRKLKTIEDYVSARVVVVVSQILMAEAPTPRLGGLKEICGPLHALDVDLRFGMRVVVGWGLIVSQ